MRQAIPKVSVETLRALVGTVERPPFLVVLHGANLAGPAGAAELAAHLAALRAEPDGGWVLVRDIPPQLVYDYEGVKNHVGRYLSAPRTLLSAVHNLGDEIVALVYVDAAPRGFEVMAADAVFGDDVVFRTGDVFVRRAGRTERWKPAQATRLVERVVERHTRPPEAAPAPARPAAEADPKPTAATIDALLAAAGDDVVAAYAAGGLAVRLRLWPSVRAAAARQGPPDTLSRAEQLTRAVAAYRADGADHNAVLDSLCQLDVYAALVALGSGGTCGAGFARYWAQRARPAFRAVVGNPEVRAAIFPGDDAALAAALRTLDGEAVSEGYDSGGWPGIGDPDVEAFLARAPG